MFFDGYSDRYRLDSGGGAGNAPYRRLLEAYLIELDPVVDGFDPVFVELYAVAGAERVAGYEVRQSATGSANRLLVFGTQSEDLARAVYEGGLWPDFSFSPGAAGTG